MVKPASNDNTSTLTSTDSCNDSIDFHFPSFDNYLDSSYSQEEDSFASKLIKSLFPTKSGWIPPDGRFSSLDLYINTCRDQISKINFRSKLNYSNLTSAELTAIKSLCKHKDIVIKEADKGGCVVVWRRDLYLKEGLSQLENSPDSSLFNSKVKRNPINSFNKTIITTIKDEIEANNLPTNATSLIHFTSTYTNFLYASKDSQTTDTHPWSPHCQLHILSNIANCQILRSHIITAC